MFQQTIIALTALFLAACSKAEGPLVTVSPAATTVAVVAAIPPTFRVATTGLTVFENALDVVDVTDWHMDNLAYEAARSALAPRFSVERVIPTDPVVDNDAPLNRALNSRTAIERQAESFVGAGPRPDYYVVLSPGNGAQPGSGRPNINIGVGISKARNPFVTSASTLHTFLLLTVLDGKTLKTVAEAPLVKPNLKAPGHFEAPRERMTDFQWQDYWHEWSPAQQDQVRERTMAMLKTSVEATVRKVMALP